MGFSLEFVFVFAMQNEDICETGRDFQTSPYYEIFDEVLTDSDLHRLPYVFQVGIE